MEENFELNPNWVSKSYYLSAERLAKLDYDLATMDVTDEEIAQSLTDEAINSLPSHHGCVITTIESNLEE